MTEQIRTPAVSMAASKVSAVPAVRKLLFRLQRDLAEKNNVIMDGRDIGTVVLPGGTGQNISDRFPGGAGQAQVCGALREGHGC